MQRRKLAPAPKYGRLGVTGVFAVVALVVIFIAGWLVDRRSATAADRRLADLARTADESPLSLVQRAARASRIVFLADIHNATSTKELAAQAIARIATSSGLDAVLIDVGADQQPYIDAYLDRTPEDASVLMAHPRTLGDPGSATRAYLDIYHTIWKLNEKLGADQRIRVVAADLPGWPPATPSPTETARKMAARDAYMQKVLNEQVLASYPDSRVLVFMDGLHALKTGEIVVQTGGNAPVTVEPFAARLASTTSEVYSILVDAPAGGVTGRQLVSYDGTAVGKVLEQSNVKRRFAATVGIDFDYLRDPIIEKKSPGLEYSVQPRDYKLSDVADAYINLGR